MSPPLANSLSTSFSSSNSSSAAGGSSSNSSSMKVTSTQSPRASSSSSSVQVIIRLRPLNDREKKYGTLPVVTASTLDKSVTAIKGKGKTKSKQTFQFDNVFTSFSTQEDIFEATLQPIIRDVLNGYESTVFAYGQVCVLYIYCYIACLFCLFFFFGLNID
jgi:hypothetical protein